MSGPDLGLSLHCDYNSLELSDSAKRNPGSGQVYYNRGVLKERTTVVAVHFLNCIILFCGNSHDFAQYGFYCLYFLTKPKTEKSKSEIFFYTTHFPKLSYFLVFI